MFFGFCLLFTLGIFISVFFPKNIYLSIFFKENNLFRSHNTVEIKGFLLTFLQYDVRIQIRTRQAQKLKDPEHWIQYNPTKESEVKPEKIDADFGRIFRISKIFERSKQKLYIFLLTRQAKNNIFLLNKTV